MYLSYLPYIWVTFHASELPSMYLSYLPCINRFGLIPSASCPVNSNVNDEECLPFVSVSKGCTSVLEV